MELDPALQTFIAESRELLDNMERALLSVGQDGDDHELVNSIFRTAHTIKGSSGLFGLDHVVAFTHVVEGLLDRIRGGKLVLAEELVALLLRCHDHMAVLVDAVADAGADVPDAVAALGDPLIGRLRGYFEAGTSVAPEAAESADAAGQAVATPATGEREHTAPGHWYVSLRFAPNVLRDGMDPLSFVRYLERLGRITGIALLTEGLPELAGLNPELCYMGLAIALDSDADKAAIEDVFEFVRDDCQIEILPPSSHISKYVRLIRELPDETLRLGEMLVRCGTVTASELDAALDLQTVQAAEPPEVRRQPLGEVLIAQGAVQPAVVDAALEHQSRTREKLSRERTIRVDADKLDRLINQVGELIIAGAGVGLVARSAHNAELLERASTLSSLVEAVRDSALQLRMVRIGATFNRFQRVVYDTARELGKDIRLEIAGEDTELDKTVVESIADPLMHLVRNAIDHGIESEAVRVAAGKPVQGVLRLNAYHDSGAIVIEVNDDGGGLRRERILAKGIERGLVDAAATLTDSEIFNLVFEPGFSTSAQVTSLSGRGVGMDVVKRNITALRGTVDIHSQADVGTTVTLRLPLTLAIIDGFQVTVGKTSFIVPLDTVEECVELADDPGDNYISLRGQVLPFIRLRELFGIAGGAVRRENIVVLRCAGQRAGLVVDALQGEAQTVIKPMGSLFSRVSCISGSTILGNGSVALILDVPSLVASVIQRSTAMQGLQAIDP